MTIGQKDRQRPAAGPVALSPVAADVDAEIELLKALDLDGLRLRWRAILGRTAPTHLSKHLLLRILAYRLQAQAHGDVSRATVQFLDGLARHGGGDGRSGVAVELPTHGALKPGTVLVREHDGKRHQVTVAEGGFIWNGTTYPSLTKIAQTITGTNWNGPRFFGLRDKPKEQSK
jgi:hypothetical protein